MKNIARMPRSKERKKSASASTKRRHNATLLVPYEVRVRLTGEIYSVCVTIFEYYRFGRREGYRKYSLFKNQHSDEHAKATVDALLKRLYPKAKLVPRYERRWPKGVNPYKPPRGVILGITHTIPRSHPLRRNRAHN